MHYVCKRRESITQSSFLDKMAMPKMWRSLIFEKNYFPAENAGNFDRGKVTKMPLGDEIFPRLNQTPTFSPIR